MVDPEPGNPEPDKRVGPAEGLTEVDLGETGKGDTNITEDDGSGVLVVVNRAAGIEVVDTTAVSILLALATALTLALVEVVASHVGDEVVGPADKLLHDQHEEGEQRSLLSQFAQLMNHLADLGSILLLGAGQEDHVSLHVAGGLVVGTVG